MSASCHEFIFLKLSIIKHPTLVCLTHLIKVVDKIPFCPWPYTILFIIYSKKVKTNFERWFSEDWMSLKFSCFLDYMSYLVKKNRFLFQCLRFFFCISSLFLHFHPNSRKIMIIIYDLRLLLFFKSHRIR